MNSKQVNKENQRIERITTHTLIVGIDIAKETHAVQAANFRGIVLTKRAIRVKNSNEGFEYLLKNIRHLQRIYNMDDVIVGMESTGIYWFNLAGWLKNRNIEVVLVNPATTRRNKENRDNTPSKSDPKDAIVIADAVSRGYYTPLHETNEAFERIHVLMKNREAWVKQSTRVGNQIIGWLDLRFPEYTSVIKDVFCPRSLATLRAFPAPSDLAELNPEDVMKQWTLQGMKRPGGVKGRAKAVKLLMVAKKSIGSTTGLEEDKQQLQYLLEAYELFQRNIHGLDTEIESILGKGFPNVNKLESIGLTPTYIAAIFAFGGDLRNFEHGNQLLRKAGLNLAERTSGKYKGKIKLSKRGSSRLRKYLYLAVLHLISVNETFKSWHEQNVEEKRMTGMRSVMKLIGKLARILVAIARTGTTFLPQGNEFAAA
jgi:transposase